MNQLSETFIESEIGFSSEEIENAHNFAFIVNEKQQQKIDSLLHTYHS
ncbi:hypothetical protein [Jeotgalibaca dankookensis]|nr:hypothetical protein [Jeotgalibaca dankookensis]